MKRSLLYQVGGPDGVSFEALSREVQVAEALGLDTVWCFPSTNETGGFGGSAPEIWLAGLAARTRRVRLGWGVAGLLPPARPPLRVAEQGASLDLATGGRTDLALLPEGALDGEGEPESDWQEGYRMLVDMWDVPKFSWTSSRFQVQPVDVVPKPVQRPHPPLWLAGWSEAHARAAGRGGLGYLDLSGADEARLEVHRDAYGSGRAEAEPGDLVCVSSVAAVADVASKEEASERFAGWSRLGIDHAILRAGPVDGGSEESLRRMRLFTAAAADVH